MIEGTYDVAINTPKYHKRATLALKQDGEAVIAQMSLSEHEPLEFSGSGDNEGFTLEGSCEVPGIGLVEYQVSGSVWGNSLSIDGSSSIGRIEIYGTRLSTSAGGFKSSHDYLMRASTGDFSADDNTMYSGLYADGA